MTSQLQAASPAASRARIGDYLICSACGVCLDLDHPRHLTCQVCLDDRQYVPPGGQRWSTRSQIEAAGGHTVPFDIEPGLLGLAVEPELYVNHRAILVTTPAGNLLWDPTSYLDDATVELVGQRGRLAAVAASHPHLYGAAAEWSRVFDVPVYLNAAEADWLTRGGRVESWTGSACPVDGLTLIQAGGHFPGSSVLHLTGADGKGVLLVGDTVMVSPGEDWVSFNYSSPNRLPLPERLVRPLVDTLAAYDFDRIHGGWRKSVRRDAKQVLRRSAERHIAFLRGDLPAY